MAVTGCRAYPPTKKGVAKPFSFRLYSQERRWRPRSRSRNQASPVHARIRLPKSSPHRIEPGCRYFEACGGCHYQHASYDQQLEIKNQILRETSNEPQKWNCRSISRSTPRRPGTIATARASSADCARIQGRIFPDGIARVACPSKNVPSVRH